MEDGGSLGVVTVIAAPVDVDAAAVGAGELGEGEAGRVG